MLIAEMKDEVRQKESALPILIYTSKLSFMNERLIITIFMNRFKFNTYFTESYILMALLFSKTQYSKTNA